MRNFLSRLFTLTGVFMLLISVFLMWQRNNPSRLRFKFDQVSAAEIEEELASPNSKNVFNQKPIAIRIKSINVELPIIESQMINGSWETTDKGVSFLETSTIPGEIGNSIMYGHNWGNILGDLDRVSPGQKIEVMFDSGAIRNFIVEYTQEVDPSNSDILAKTDDRRLTLYTCSGFLDSKRFVVTAFYQE